MKNIIKYISETIRPPLLVLFTFFIAGNTMAQNTQLTPQLQQIASAGSTREWITFRNVTINPRTIFIDYKNGFELSADDEMTIQKVNKDDIGFNHFKYQQYYKNHPVVYGEYIIHQQPDGIVKSGNGRIITGLKLSATASVQEKQALDAALRFMNAGKYLWQNAEMEKALKQQEKDQPATYYPKGELVYAPNNWEATFKPSDYRLAWHFKIYPDASAVMAKDVYVDALTGKVIHYTDISMNCSGGTGTTAYNGSKSINTELSGGVYRSHNNCQSTNIYVYNCNRGNATNTFYTDGDNSWTATSQQSAVQAQWGALETYRYYLNTHSRTSWDNSAGDLIAYNNAVYGNPATANNACWGCAGNAGIFGAGSTTAATDDWNTDDIMGHEFTHGVTQSEADLDYNKESGALNESFSDIFGEMVESYAEGTCDYLVGADRGAIRSFINPNSYGDPDTYKGTNWYNTVGCSPSKDNDNCGVHTNSSVQNHWFYLLAEGGSGTNDNGQSYNVKGIDRFKARLIAYRALTVYLTSSSQYIDARKASLEAAYDLYGQCSQEIISVGDAWHAVGVESQSPAYSINVCGVYPLSGDFKQAISTLTAANGCTTTITASSTTVYFTARDKVVLYPGFTAVSGSNFVAYLEPCSSTRWLTPPNEIMSDAEERLQSSAISKADVVPSAAESNKMTAVKETVSVAPNPFNGSFILTINAQKDAKAQVTLYNSFGARMQQKTGINLKKGVNKISFSSLSFAAGTYMLEVNFGESKVMKKIIKE